jgi:hypothetical protein
MAALLVGVVMGQVKSVSHLSITKNCKSTKLSEEYDE